MEYLVHGKKGILETINGDFEHVDIPSVTPFISEQQALKKALDSINAKEYKWESKNYEEFLKQRTNNPDTTYYPKGELVIVRDYSKTGYNLKLAWKFIISTLIPNNELLIYIDANTGKVISKRSLLLDSNTPGTAETLYSGSQEITCDSYSGGYRLEESRNGVSIKTYNSQETQNYSNIDFVNSNTNWTNGSWANFSQDQQALDVQWGAEKVLDFWQTFFNRKSLDGNGLRILSYVHFTKNVDNSGWDDAQWDPMAKVAAFGDGDSVLEYPNTSLDEIGHELGHGINEFTADLGSSNYNQECDALNEGFSDIWGTCVKHWVEPSKPTWLWCNDIVNKSWFDCIRNLQNPPDQSALEGKHPDSYHDQYWSDSGEPHTNSTVLSHWFYLISQGGNGTNDLGDAYSVNGIGIDEAQQIAFIGETNLFPSATYNDARNAMINAATDLYGSNSCELVNVTNAWYAVGVGEPFHYSDSFLSESQAGATSASDIITFNTCSHVYSINWSHSSNLVYISGQGTFDYEVQASNCSISELGLVKAIVNTGYSNDTLKIYVWAGLPYPPVILPQTIEVQPNTTVNVTAPSPGAESWDWSISGGTILSGQGTRNISVQTSPYCIDSLRIRVTASNACGSQQLAKMSVPFYCPGGGGLGGLSVSPNPANQTLNVELTDTTSTTTNQATNEAYMVQLIDRYNKPVYQRRETLRRFTINVSGYRRGIYYLRITKGDNVYVQKIVIVH